MNPYELILTIYGSKYPEKECLNIKKIKKLLNINIFQKNNNNVIENDNDDINNNKIVNCFTNQNSKKDCKAKNFTFN